MKKTYNKLVRNKIPEIILSSGGIPKIRILDDTEFLSELNKKLKEELTEYLTAKPNEAIEELADIVEVIEAILNCRNTNFGELLKTKQAKTLKRGAFEERIFLESVEEGTNEF